MDVSTEPADGEMPMFKKRGPKKSSMRKRAATPPAEDSDSAYSSTDDEASGRRIKRRKRTGGVVTASNTTAQDRDRDLSTTKFAADHSARVTDSNDATKHADWFEDPGNMTASQLLGAAARRDKNPLAPKGGATYDTSALAGRKLEPEQDAGRSVKGPVKAPANVRMITLTDYAPDVCKDYKQTGFCGFGDNCKYLHERSDYKAGWQLDREWETVTKGKKNLGGTVVARRGQQDEGERDEDEELAAQLEGIPFACIICRSEYKNPIVTKCGHYFCEACAIKRFRKKPSCAACGSGTGGVFNGAKNLKKLLEKKKQRAAERREKAREAGEEVSEEEEEEELPQAVD